VSPIKLVVIAILLYFGYRLLVSDWRKKKDKSTDDPINEIKDDGSVEDVLVEDPVCHTLVPKKQAIHLRLADTREIIYFCSEECCNIYVNKEGEKG
jgi:YHS domain-containing protein